MERAVNPTTGEVVFLVDNQWVAPSQTAKNATGVNAYLVNDAWVTPNESGTYDYADKRAAIARAATPTSNPLVGMAGRAAAGVGSLIEGVARVAEPVADFLETNIPLSGISKEDIKNKRQLEPMFKVADQLRDWDASLGYQPSTKLSDLGSNPLKVVPFIAERVISSSPDMAAAVLAAPAYMAARTNEILNERIKNDNKNYEDLTVKDVALATAAAVAEAKLEQFTTKRLLKGAPISGKSAGTRILKEGAIQSATGGAEEGIGYLGGTFDTKKGVDTKELLESIAEGAIVEGGLGAGVRGVREYRARGKDAEAAAKTSELSPEDTAAREKEQQTAAYMRAQRDEQEAAKAAQAPFIGQKETPEGQFGLNLEGGKRIAPTETLQGGELPERKAGFDAYGRPKAEEPTTAAPMPMGSTATPMTQALDATQTTQQHRAERDGLLQQLNELPDTTENRAIGSQMAARVRELNKLIKTAESVPAGTQGALPVVPSAEPTQAVPTAPAAPAPTTSALVKAAGIPASAPVAQQLKKLDLTQQADRTAAAQFIATALENKNVRPETKTALQAFYDQHIAQPAPEGQGGLDLGEPQPLAQAAPPTTPPAPPVVPPTPPSIPPTPPMAPAVAVTPDTAPPVIDATVWKALGIGPTAAIRRNVDVNGKDITDPTNGAFVRQALEAYRDASRNDRIKANIDRYLARFPAPEAKKETKATPKVGSEVTALNDKVREWDKANRTMRNESWQDGALQANPAFEAVKAQGSAIPAHGMSKVSTLGQGVKDLIAMVNGGIRPGLYFEALTRPDKAAGAASASGTAGGVAYRDGPFIITFREGITSPTSADITGVLVNPSIAEIIPALRAVLPNVRIESYQDVQTLLGEPKTTVATPTAPTPPPPAPKSPVEQRVESDQIEAWALTANPYVGNGDVVYADATKGLVRVQLNDGTMQYRPMTATKIGKEDISQLSYVAQGALGLTPQDVRGLVEARNLIEARENALLAQFPDGPFTDAANNVVATENVDPRYTQYLTALMQKLGMGDVNLFLVSGKDLENNKNKYHLHGAYGTLATAGNSDSRNGMLIPFGPRRDTLAIYIDPTMPEAKALETIAHELGHGIEYTSFVHAPQATKDAIVAEYTAWKAAARNMNVEQFMNSLRNRESAAINIANQSPEVLASPAKDVNNFESYWASFPEWFADNVSRWATTDAKAVSLVAKFFQAVAKQLRALAAAVTGTQFNPATSVADFLNAMGPANPVMWQGAVADRLAGNVRVRYEESLVDPQQMEDSTIVQTSQSVNTPPGQITPATWASINQAKSQPQRTAMTQFAAVQAQNDITWADWFRQKTVDVFAPVATKLSALFDQGVRNSFGDVNPVQFIRQAFDHARVALDVFRQGGLRMNKDGFWESYQLKDSNGKEMSAQQVVRDIAALSKQNNEAYNVTKAKVATILEGMRLSDMRKENADKERLAQAYEARGEFDKADKIREKKFLLHMSFAEIDSLVQVFNASPEIQEIQRIMNASRESVVDAMVTSGRISKDRGDIWKAVTNYVPFDRENNVFEDLSLTQRPTRKGISALGELPALRGSLKRPVVNTVDNYMNTMAWMVDQSMRNSAAVRVLNLMATPGVDMAKKLPSMNQAANTHMVVPKLYENGEPVYYELHSPYDFAAFVQAPEIKSGALKLLGASSRLLRTTVTATPMFAIKQVIDDAQRVMFYSGVKNPTAALATVFKHFPSAWFGAWIGKQSGLEKKLVSLGIIGDYDFNPTNPIETLEYQTGAEKRGGVRWLINKLEQVTKASDMAARMAVYEQTLKETGDPAVAQVRARELINFNRRGSSKAMNVLSHTVPFFNAYAQGLDLMYRGVTGKDASSGLNKSAARNFFISRMAVMSVMGLMYAWAMSDDDQYEDLTDEVRDRNWILPKSINEGLGLPFAIKISVPAELGFIFKSIPERVVSYMKSASKGEDQGVGHAVTSTLGDALKTYGNVPIPPVLKSAIENVTNHSFFTHRELVPKAMQERPPALQYTSNTSELGKAIGQSANVSPIKVDNWIRGTFGLMGASGLLVTDAMMNPARPDRSLAQIPFMSIALVNPAGSRVKDEFYEFRQQITEAVAAKNMLEKENPVKYSEFVQKNYHLLAAAPYVNQKLKVLSELRAAKEMFTHMPATSMSSAEKRKNIDEINKIEKVMLSDMRTMRSAIQKAGPK